SELKSLLRRAEAIDAPRLAQAERVTLDALRWQLQMGLERLSLDFHQWGGFSTVGIDHVSGIHAWIPTAIETAQPMRTEKDAAALARRLKAMPHFFRNHVRNLKDGLRAGRTPARIAVERTLRQLEQFQAMAPSE